MESPDPKLRIATSDTNQGSPFFKFLCSLSPINPVKSGPSMQMFAELNFSAPPAVFISPRGELQKDSARSKRKILADSSIISPLNTESEGCQPKIQEICAKDQLITMDSFSSGQLHRQFEGNVLINDAKQEVKTDRDDDTAGVAQRSFLQQCSKYDWESLSTSLSEIPAEQLAQFLAALRQEEACQEINENAGHKQTKPTLVEFPGHCLDFEARAAAQQPHGHILPGSEEKSSSSYTQLTSSHHMQTGGDPASMTNFQAFDQQFLTNILPQVPSPRGELGLYLSNCWLNVPLQQSLVGSASSHGLRLLPDALSGYDVSVGQPDVASLVKDMNQHQLQPPIPDEPRTCVQSVNLGRNSLNVDIMDSAMQISTHPLEEKWACLQEMHPLSESEQADDSSQSPRSPKKRRKTFVPAGDNSEEGCKHCKCKKSRCLKLYCECFAAGLYCIDSCHCHDCFNKPEFKETVLGTRHQIESRNPLAFAPKIVRGSDSSPVNGEEFSDTPVSARHKRGCNCRKSQCLKKYCECYQAGVGCADGCRCKGCKNVYGRNEGSGEQAEKEEILPKEKMTSTDEISLSDSENREECLMTEQQNAGLSPITPFLDQSGQSRPVYQQRASEEYSPFAIPPLIPFRTPVNLFEPCEGDGNYLMADSARFIPPSGHQAEMFTTKPFCHQQPFPIIPPFVGKKNACPSFWQPINNLRNTSNAETPLSAVVIPDILSHRVHADENGLALPSTPLLPSSVNMQYPRSALECLSDTEVHLGSLLSDEDSTPTVLKELNGSNPPSIILKTRSPQQKRVSPYRQNLNTSHERGLISPGVRRKFILQAVPSSMLADLTSIDPKYMNDISNLL